ncbi:hypothetical protein ACWD0Z_04835 [Streptomyces sp. NPDC003007]
MSSEPCHVPTWRYLFGHSPLSRSSRGELQGCLAAVADAAGHRTRPRRAYASPDFAARTVGPATGSISLARLASDPLGPGRFLLTGTADLRRALHQVADTKADLAVVQSGDGQETLVHSRPPVRPAEDVPAGAYPALRPATSRAAEKGSSPSMS